MRFVSLFAGIGGMDLGLERAGMSCVAQVENDPWCQQVLAKHWPDVPRWGDIHNLDPNDLPEHDLIAGGFPCQPVSLAGARKAQDDDRWLWPEYFRIVRGTRPRWVVVENVPGLTVRGLDTVLGDLAGLGYDAEWRSLRAADVGASHRRSRVFIVAYPDSFRRNGRAGVFRPAGWVEPEDRGSKIRSWPIEPEVGRVAYGVPRRVDRLRGLGNAVVPQVAQLVGRAIMDAQ